MSATPTRPDWQASAEASLPVDQSVRVLASIGNQEGLRALLAFSDLHENMRSRRLAPGGNGPGGNGDDQSLFQTERFVFEEVLQLICVRAQALTQADAVLVALREGANLVCRASAGTLPIPQGLRLNSESQFLRACLESGKILRCDDIEEDERMRADFARQLGARSAVIIPLCGRHESLGVMQAFAATSWAFTDQDIRCFDLFTELVLAALKPADQDRRLHWLSDVAGELLQSKISGPQPATDQIPAENLSAIQQPPAPFAQIEASTLSQSAIEHPPAPATQPAQAPVSHSETIPSFSLAPTAPAAAESILAPPAAPAATEPTPHAPPEISSACANHPIPNPFASEESDLLTSTTGIGHAFIEAAISESASDFVAAPAPSAAAPPAVSSTSAELETLTQPLVIPVAMYELPGPELDEAELPTYLTFEKEQPSTDLATNPSAQANSSPSFLRSLAGPFSSRPGLSVVLTLAMVAGLFSAGVWWGMQAHTSEPARIAHAPKSVTAPAAPASLAPTVMDTAAPPAIQDDASQVPVPDDKLASLPKITGIRHWSSSVGSTVVIDLEDQVNYEVHRLMAPERIYFDLHDTALPQELEGKTMDVGESSLTRVRVAQPVAGITRVVLDTRDGANFSVSMETNPYRLVVELRDSTKLLASGRVAPSLAAKPAVPKPVAQPPIAASSSPSPQVAGPRTGKFRIVLDAGHGGWDLGTVGRKGLLEKDLVLDVADRLGKLLKSRLGAEVLFTRTGDEYVPLDQRADFANQSRADLFVSVHANYSSSATARGVETYYTNLFSAPGSRELDKHTDATLTPSSLVSLSADGLREKIDDSRRLASSVQHALYGALASKNPDIRDRGIKDASFVVLTGTTMPSILTEISFVSSPADEHNLQSEAYRQQIAEALYKGIAHYQESSKSKMAQLRPGTTGR